MKLLTINVTQEHIDANDPFDTERCCTCPVARAMACALGQPVEVSGVSWGFFKADPNAHDAPRWHRLPANVVALIDELDEGRTVQPFTFTVEIP